ncbi:Phospholipid-transporting atpase [Thalictrum thalictroides]|uniref:Phospholipid-transporting ATPase n=1 Tax=Thalictrum thalictroides TaxID=46969 RepID=A0A7J6V5B5_THATH|nr:Phospholipid-transporting atpase [Thalictrum thalictroides]
MAKPLKGKRKVRWSKLYSFARTKPATIPSKQVGGPGFTRVVFCNESHLHEKKPYRYPKNYISTTRYNFVTFLPKALFEQFRRVANLYFLLAAILSVTAIAPFSSPSVIAPLVFVVGISMVKEAVEDWHRFIQDLKENSRMAKVHVENGIFVHKPWKSLCVGDVVKVEKNGYFPSDLLLISSSYEDGLCYVETMNLDGETNLKAKRSLEVTLALDEDMEFNNFKATICCEDPNPNLYSFVGNLEFQGDSYPLCPAQILLRDSKLRNTEYVYGVIIFSGMDTKVVQNSTRSPSKRSRVERKMDLVIYLLFSMLVFISLLTAVGSAYYTKYEMKTLWYLRPDDTDEYFNPSKPLLSGALQFIRALILYGYLIPISLYVSIEVVKVLQAMLINKDIELYDETTCKSVEARTSNLNEELGQVEIILTDKTGTLTCNQMEFRKCSIAGVSYGGEVSQVGLAATKIMNTELEKYSFYSEETDSTSQSFEMFEFSIADHKNQNDSQVSELAKITIPESPIGESVIKGFNFDDERLLNKNWINRSNIPDITMFFRVMALCHTGIPVDDDGTEKLKYEAESPEEVAFLIASQEFGFQFFQRTQSTMVLKEVNPASGGVVEREYKLLNMLEFSSSRKRMSVIIKDEDDQIFLLSKGADSIIYDMLADNGKLHQWETSAHLSDYAEDGLRTLAFAYRKIESEEYVNWNTIFTQAKARIGPERDELLESASKTIEKDLILLGAVAVEDKLQRGAMIVDILVQIETAYQVCCKESNKDAPFALIVDGKALELALRDDVKDQFLQLAVNCASVICCRVSPKQKALVKEYTGKTTLAIGDGANDVGMIQEADIGVGISGMEGMQAVMASDFSLPQFRFLERLLIVHGHWCYKRISKMILYFVYKNIAFGLTLFYYQFCTSFSGDVIYDDWYMVLFNVILTSLPVISLGVLDQDVSSDVCLQFPALYQQGQKNIYFSWTRIVGCVSNGLITSFSIFILSFYSLSIFAFREEGEVPDMSHLGATIYTCVIWTVNCQITLVISHFTWIQHFFIWGSIGMWYIFLYVYGLLPPMYSTTGYHLLTEALGTAPIYWLVTLFVVVASLLPYFLCLTIQRLFYPMDDHIIQEMKYTEKDVTENLMWLREQSNSRKKTHIGFSTRVEAKIRYLKGQIHQKKMSLYNSMKNSPFF